MGSNGDDRDSRHPGRPAIGRWLFFLVGLLFSGLPLPALLARPLALPLHICGALLALRRRSV